MITTANLMRFFYDHNIYVGSIDKTYDFDDNDEEYLAGYLVCFSNHDNRLVLPINVLMDLQTICSNATIAIEQRGAKECGKELYMYIRITF